MKTLFEFTLTKNLIDGTTENKIYSLALIRPSSSLKEDAEVFHAKTLSDLVSQGVLTRQMLQKRLINDGGTLSEKEKQETVELYKSFFDVQEKYQSILRIPIVDRTEEQKQEFENLIVLLTTKHALIQDFERSQISLFDNTAEIIARNRLIFWWILHLTFEKDNEKYIPFFKGENYPKKRDSYDEYLEDDYFYNVVWVQLIEYVSAWYMGRAKTKDDFIKLSESIKIENDKTS